MIYIYLYFGKKNITLYLDKNHEKNILYKDYNEKDVIKKIILYMNKNNMYNITVVSNRLYYNIDNMFNKEFIINWNLQNKKIIKNRLNYIRIYNILEKMYMI